MPTLDSPGLRRGRRIDDWFRAGGTVIASSERLARSLRGSFNRRRQAEGLTAWPTPVILEWRAFVRREWDKRFSDGRMILSALQEEWLFARIAEHTANAATVLHGPRLRLAAMARQAHDLLCSYAPEYLDHSERDAWPGDADTFNEWLAAFDTQCADEGWISTARLPLQMIPKLEGDAETRPSLLLAGFDRVTPTQALFFAAWGAHETLPEEDTLATVNFYEAQDAATELAACALWCRARLQADPSSRLLVIAQDADQRRGEIGRAFSRYLDPNSAVLPPLEFSLGIPLAHTPLVRGALLMLRWVSNKPIDENELDWLMASGLTATSDSETASLQRQMKSIRQRQLQRPEWTLEAFINAKPGGIEVPASWSQRMLSALRRLQPYGQRKSAIEWSELLPLCMKDAGWPGAHPMPSANFQALDHWNKAIEAAGTLGFDCKQISWPVFHSAVARLLEDSLFSPESELANILIAGPAQSAGLVADAIWFLGVEEDSWPFAGQIHPFLPLFLQRQFNMPHSSTQNDTDLARCITDRLLHSAPEVCFSSARLRGKVEANPSHLIVGIAGTPVPPPEHLVPDALPPTQTFTYEDNSTVPFPGTKAEGGSGTLTSQSQCAFRTFATARLGAKAWDQAETGLNFRQRGDLVHSVLHSIWGGPAKNGWRTSDELQSMLTDNGREGLEQFVGKHVAVVMSSSLPAHIRDRMSKRYLELEEARLVKLVTEWLLYESTRARFTVIETEQKTPVVIAGLALDLRLDRRDLLDDGSTLVVDYKTGQASPDRWTTDRPEDVQLPLYAAFAVNQVAAKDPGGLVFGKVKISEHEFLGRVRDPKSLLPDLGKTGALVKNPLTDEQLLEWRWVIERLAVEFLQGRAAVNPRDYPDTCEYCSLSALCRVAESKTGQ
jgi:probable DNA repair protein